MRAAYDDQLRTEAEMRTATDVQRRGPLWWGRFGQHGFVTYRDLGGLEGADLDRLVATTVAHFRDASDVDSFEWKTRGHDVPDDLGERLEAHGLAPEPVETVMIGEASALAVDVPLAVTPEGPVVVRRVEPGPDAARDLARMGAVQEEIFGGGRGPGLESSLADLTSGESEFWLAEVGDRVVCAGRLTPVPGTDFAGIWGGGTLPGHRGRGIYRAVVAARARSAVAAGVRWINSDCTDMSRPILERSGLVAVTTTTPYVWTRRSS